MKTIEIIRRESHTEQLFFTAKPDKATRAALRRSGYRWNGIAWWRNTNETSVMKPKELPSLLTPVVANVG